MVQSGNFTKSNNYTDTIFALKAVPTGNQGWTKIKEYTPKSILTNDKNQLLNQRNVVSSSSELNISYVGNDFKDIMSSTKIPLRFVTTPYKVLNYLYSISGYKTVAGQHNREPISLPDQWTNAINETTGKYPGFWSSDFLFEQDSMDNRQMIIDEAIKQWDQGAIVHLMYHACPPTTSEACEWEGGVKSHLSDDQWNDLITDGSNLNNIWKSRLDRIAVNLQSLKDRRIEVLWRPLHEMNQGVFWWGGRPGPNGTRRLYQITHDYLVKIKGLTNLIWVWNVQDFQSLSQDLGDYNPGDSYWDIAALDIYGSDGQGFTQDKYLAMVGVARGKPIAIGECDLLPKASELAAQPLWTYFMAWSELVYRENSEQDIRDLYNAANILTRDELLSWR
jgi:mannan endo-1,4-beta-mannosidase